MVEVEQERVLVVPDDRHGARLDVALSGWASVSRAQARRLIDAGEVSVDGRRRRPSWRLSEGERVVWRVPEAPPSPKVRPEALPLTIVYEDASVVVVDKAAGMVVHPGAGQRSGTLVAALLARYGGLPGAPERPGLIHRLDKLTTGLMVAARTERSLTHLQGAMAARTIARQYVALAWGVPVEPEGVVATRVARSRRDRRRMAASDERGRPADTRYQLVEAFRRASLLQLTLGTGRTHQIRVHLQHLGHPVVGDATYGGRQASLMALPAHERGRGKTLLAKIDRQALHAQRLSFPHPEDGTLMSFESPLPGDFQACLDYLRRDWAHAAGGRR